VSVHDIIQTGCFGVRGFASADGMIEIMRYLATKRNRIRPFICRDSRQGAVYFGEVVDRRGRGEVGLVKLADKRQ